MESTFIDGSSGLFARSNFVTRAAAMASGSSSPANAPSSAAIHTVRDVRDQSDWQKTVQKALTADQMRADRSSRPNQPTLHDFFRSV